jgi:hypothetical protein
MLLNTKLKTDIFIEFGELRPMVAWLERNCIEEWRYECKQPAGRDAGIYEFYFENEKDLVAFKMWKQ